MFGEGCYTLVMHRYLIALSASENMKLIVSSTLFMLLLGTLVGCSDELPGSMLSESETVEATDSEKQIVSEPAGSIDRQPPKEKRSSSKQSKVPDANVSEASLVSEDEPNTRARDEESVTDVQNKISLREATVDVVEWVAPRDVAYKSAMVTVIGPDGTRHELEFGAGQPLSFDKGLQDGLYRWESVVTPQIDSYAKEKMQAARNSGNLSAQQQVLEELQSDGYYPSAEELENNTQSGGFVVKDGVVTPTSIEPMTDDADD